MKTKTHSLYGVTLAGISLLFLLFLMSASYCHNKYGTPAIIATAEASDGSSLYFTPDGDLNALQGEYEASVRSLNKATINLAYAKLKRATELSDKTEIIRLQSLLRSLGEEIVTKNTSLEKLAWAVAMHETHNCADVTNFTKVNNCHGIRFQRDGRLQPARFATIQDSHNEFINQWNKWYGGRAVPTEADAEKWSGGDNSEAWLSNVLYYLNN